MKKFLLPIAFGFFVTLAHSQDFKDVDKAMLLRQPEAAKTALDKILADPKVNQKPSVYFYTGAVYATIYADSALHNKYQNPEVTADEAFKKYIALDTSFSMVTEYKGGTEGGVRPIFDLYSTSFNDGIRTFNAKKWDSASHYFSIAEYYSEIIYKRKWSASTASFDSNSTQYAGYAYQNSNKPDSAMKYYSIIAANKLGGDSYKDIYRFMLNYYSQKNDKDNFRKILAEAREIYPADKDLWNQWEMQDMNNNAGIDDIISKYKQEDAAGKLTTSDQYIGYGESFAGLTKDQLSKIDSAKQVDIKYLAADAYVKAFALQPNGLYAFNAGVMYYNVYGSLDERFFNLRGESAALKTQRSAVEKQEWPLADSSIKWLTQAYTILKAKTDRTKIESNSLNRSVDFLANVYGWKRDKSRGVKPADVDKYDALFKQFDSEHDKYKQ